MKINSLRMKSIFHAHENKFYSYKNKFLNSDLHEEIRELEISQ